MSDYKVAEGFRFEIPKGTNLKVGDTIQCWSSLECTRTMMVLASKGILADEDKVRKNLLRITKIGE